MKIILASNSPRRKDLLSKIGIDFEIIVSNIEEIEDKNIGAKEYVKSLSYKKAKNVFDRTNGERVVIGSDTVVSFKNKILEKPKNKQDAFKMLKMLQGNVCEVLSGLCVINSKNDNTYITYNKCKVYLQKMSDIEINEYIETSEPLDKAGAFAIQGFGAKYISKIKGDYYSVVGLPVNKLYNLLKKII